MAGPAQCGECQAILEQLRNALAEARELLKTDNAGRDALPAFRKPVSDITAQTEEELEELLDKYPFRFQPEPHTTLGLKYPRISDAFRRMFAHKVRTGHDILRRPPSTPDE
jgi:hypothetical protein